MCGLIHVCCDSCVLSRMNQPSTHMMRGFSSSSSSSSSLLQSELDALELEKEHKVGGGRIWKMDNGNIGLYMLGTFMAVLQVGMKELCINLY